MYAGQSVEDLALPEPIQQPVQHNHHRHLAVNRPINSVYSQTRGQQDNNNKLGRYKEFRKKPEGIQLVPLGYAGHLEDILNHHCRGHGHVHP